MLVVSEVTDRLAVLHEKHLELYAALEQRTPCPACGASVAVERLDLLGAGKEFVLPNCECLKAVLSEIQTLEAAERRSALVQIWRAANLDHWVQEVVAYADWTLDSFPGRRDQAEKLADWVRAFGESRNGYCKGKLLVGAVGCGKTGLMIGAGRLMIELYGYRVGFAYVPELLERAHKGGRREVLVWQEGLRVLCLDEICPDHERTPFDRETFEMMLDRAMRLRQTVLATGNLDAKDMEKRLKTDLCDRLGEKAWSRLMALCTPTRVQGPDLRTSLGVK